MTGARGARVLLVALAIASLANGVVATLGDVEEHEGALWDLDYYRVAAANWATTGDPYLVDGSPGGYFYSPIVTPLLAWLFHGFEADLLYMTLVLAAIVGALLLAIRAAGPLQSDSSLCGLYAVAFANSEVILLLATGNLAWFVGLLQAGALVAASRGRWPLFYVLVGVGYLIKPYSLALLVLPFVLGALSRWALLSIIPLAADAIGGLLIWPELAEHRMVAIRMAVIEPLELRYSLAGRLSRVLADLGFEASPATAIAVAAQLVLAGVLALYLRRHLPADKRSAFALAAIAALAAIPRQVGYDAYAFGPAVFVGLSALGVGSRSRAVRVISVAALAAGLFKEGLAVLPLLVFAALLLSQRAEPAAYLGRRPPPNRRPE